MNLKSFLTNALNSKRKRNGSFKTLANFKAFFNICQRKKRRSKILLLKALHIKGILDLMLAEYEDIARKNRKILKKSNSNVTLPVKRKPSSYNPNPNPLLDNILKLTSYKFPQLLLAAQPYCIRTRQGQHYRHDVACLEQEFNYTPARGRFNSRGDSLVAVHKTILPIQMLKYVKMYVKIREILNKITHNIHPESKRSRIKSDCTYRLKLTLKAEMATTPWKFELRRVTIVAPKVAQRVPKRNPRDPRLPSYKRPPPMDLNGSAPIEICLLYTSPSPRDRQKSRMPSSA